MTGIADRTTTRHLIAETLGALLFQTDEGNYPYELNEDQIQPPNRFSMSTNSMVAHSLATLGGYLESVLAVPVRGRCQEFLPSHIECLERSLKRITNEILLNGPRPYLSRSFGRQDPFTLAWLVELYGVADAILPGGAGPDTKKAAEIVKNVATTRLQTAFEKLAQGNPILEYDDPASKKDYSKAVHHPLPLLRMLQLANILGVNTETNQSVAFEWFLMRLHIQLSRRGIEHSEFDIADVVVCLEGLLTADFTKVTAPIIDGVQAAIDEVRRLNPTLRPATPFKTSEQGAVHLFASVEVFGSLLRSALILEREGRPEFFVRVMPALHDYLSWLQGTKVSGHRRLTKEESKDAGSHTPTEGFPDNIPPDYAGWQSEHAHSEDRVVHTWLTSQVLLFLSGYDSLLSRQIARRALESTSLRPEAPDDKPRPGHDYVNLPEYKVISRLTEDFVALRKARNHHEPLFSCLLYGPPGTGKTTLAGWVANQLQWPLLTITTSDFIIEGEAQVEARAKKIFETLELQEDMVVFFDEIDRLVLDRDATAYSSQGDMLQFMTPSMLTKINNLRAAERIILLVGTNYAERIDAAIKRAGRIDRRILVLPPDLQGRIKYLSESLADQGRSDDEIREAALAGPLRTLAELRSAVRQVGRDSRTLREVVESITPAISLHPYKRRIDTFLPSSGDKDEHRDLCPSELLEELFLLVYLLTEGHSDGLHSRYDWVAEWWTAVRPRKVVRDVTVCEHLDQLVAR